MTNNLYAVFNNLSGRYGDVVAFPSDSFALARLAKLRDDTNEYAIYRVGTIDIESGVVVSAAPVLVPWLGSSPSLPVSRMSEEDK